MDTTQIEEIVQIITHEVLVALNEQDIRQTQAQGDHCNEECAEGICVKTCYDRVGKVITAGAERITSSLGGIPLEDKIGSMIDHTLLRPDATPDQIAQLCFEARKYQFATVCVNSCSLVRKVVEEHTGQNLHGNWISAGGLCAESESLRSPKCLQ